MGSIQRGFVRRFFVLRSSFRDCFELASSLIPEKDEGKDCGQRHTQGLPEATGSDRQREDHQADAVLPPAGGQVHPGGYLREVCGCTKSEGIARLLLKEAEKWYGKEIRTVQEKWRGRQKEQIK